MKLRAGEYSISGHPVHPSGSSGAVASFSAPADSSAEQAAFPAYQWNPWVPAAILACRRNSRVHVAFSAGRGGFGVQAAFSTCRGCSGILDSLSTCWGSSSVFSATPKNFLGFFLKELLVDSSEHLTNVFRIQKTWVFIGNEVLCEQLCRSCEPENHTTSSR